MSLNKIDINTVLLLMFLGAWLYTEITELEAREDWKQELIERIERLEELELQHEQLELKHRD